MSATGCRIGALLRFAVFGPRGIVSPPKSGRSWPRNQSSRKGVATRRKLRRVSPDTGILCLHMLGLTNNMRAVTNRDSSVTGRTPAVRGVLRAEECGWRRYWCFQNLFSPTRKHSPLVSVRETQDPCQRGADRIRNSPSPERNT